MSEGAPTWFFLNELSARVCAATVDQGSRRMDDIVVAMATLMAGRSATLVTIGEHNLWEIKLARDFTVADWLSGAEPDRRSLLLTIVHKIDFPEEFGVALHDRFHLSEFALSQGEGARPVEQMEAKGLGAAFLVAGIGVSFRTEDLWSQIQIPLVHTWLDEDCEATRQTVRAVNLSDSSQAEAISSLILDRSRTFLRDDPLTLTSRKSECFPHLTFGMDVDGHLAEIQRSLLPAVIGKLLTLDAAARDWRLEQKTTFPSLPDCHSESEPTMQQFGDLRRFRDPNGDFAIYKHHAMVGSAWRIHLRVNHMTRSVEIGYIGRHLRTVRHA